MVHKPKAADPIHVAAAPAKSSIPEPVTTVASQISAEIGSGNSLSSIKHKSVANLPGSSFQACRAVTVSHSTVGCGACTWFPTVRVAISLCEDNLVVGKEGLAAAIVSATS